MNRRPTIGAERRRYGQCYTLVSHEPRRTRTGRPFTLVRLRAACADCGAPFEFTSTWSKFRYRDPERRRCDACAAPGVPSPGLVARTEKRQRARLWAEAVAIADVAGATPEEAFDRLIRYRRSP